MTSFNVWSPGTNDVPDYTPPHANDLVGSPFELSPDSGGSSYVLPGGCAGMVATAALAATAGSAGAAAEFVDPESQKNTQNDQL